MLRAYFDASRRQSGISCVAGVAYGIDRGKKAQREWRSIFGVKGCHMTDLHARRGPFSGISDAEAGRLCRAAVRVINQYASFIAVVSCDEDEVQRLAPSETLPHSEPLLDSARSAYNCGLHWAMMAMGLLAGKGQRIDYWFERGDEFQGAARRFLSVLNDPKIEALRQSYCYGSDSFASKADENLFDTADLVAWEWGKHVDRLREGKRTRPSLEALMNGPCVLAGQPYRHSETRYANHYTGAPLENYFDKMRRIMTAATHDEVDAVIRSSV